MKQQRGMALLVVLMMLALMMLIATGINERWFLSFQRTSHQQSQLQGKWYALGMEDVAGRILLQDARDDGQHTHLAQYWANARQVFPLEDAELLGEISDAQACFNINAINTRSGSQSTEGPPYPVRLFNALLLNLGVDDHQAAGITAALQDWVDNDDQVTAQGAEDEYYAAMTPPYLTANQPLQDISELRLVRGITPELLQRLRPLVCALPTTSLKINLNTLRVTQSALLAAMTDNTLDITAAQQLIEQRPRTGWLSATDFLAQPVLVAATDLPKEVKGLLSVNSDYFTLRTVARFEDGSYILRSLLLRYNGKIAVVRRHTAIAGE